MIDPAYVRRMARYNRWQNENLYGCADGLSEAERRRERGAFFGSVHKTLNHLLWADRIWMSRFASDVAKPEGGIKGSIAQHDDWDALKRERAAFDGTMIAWAERLDAAWLAGDLTYVSSSAGEITRPKWLLVTHMFNHQTHHRGQVHCMLTQAGGKPGDTDLPFLPT
jgi:uncharacterized damage-inducible protein DinB